MKTSFEARGLNVQLCELREGLQQYVLLRVGEAEAILSPRAALQLSRALKHYVKDIKGHKL